MKRVHERLRSGAVVAALVAALVAPATVTPQPVAGDLEAASLADRLRAHVRFLGSDALGGRFPGTPGAERTVRYLASQLGSLGVTPLGDSGTFFQWVPLVEVQPLAGSKLMLTGPKWTRRLETPADYLLAAGGPETWVAAPTPMVFVGYGIAAPEYDYNDYLGVDVRGKIVVALEGEPPSTDPGYFSGDQPTVYSAFETKRRTALSRGGAGLVVLTGVASGGPLRWRELRKEYGWPGVSLAYGVPEDLALYLSPAASRAVLEGGPVPPERLAALARAGTLHAFPLNVSLEFHGRFRLRHFRAANVVGRIAGSDPKLAPEHVVVSAHWDHLGEGPAMGGDAIYNGVVDNALGTAGVLEIARMTAAAPPRRSVIILLTTAEEEGLLGSSFFLHTPPVPLDSLVADVNVDGLAFMDTFNDVIGVGSERSTLGSALRRVAGARGLEVAPLPPAMATGESFARSDQEAFAQAGIPSILVNEGMRWDHATPEAALRRELLWMATVYHTPKDDLEQPLSLEAAAEHCRLLADLVREIADSRSTPRWRPGSLWEYQYLLRRARTP